MSIKIISAKDINADKHICQEKDFAGIPMDDASKYCGFGWCWGCKFNPQSQYK